MCGSRSLPSGSRSCSCSRTGTYSDPSCPGHIDEIRGGQISGIQITQTFLLAASVYVAIASLMIFLTLVLRPTLSRWTNLVLPILYIVSIVASVIGESWVSFWFLSIAEGALLLPMIWYAWRWPTLER